MESPDVVEEKNRACFELAKQGQEFLKNKNNEEGIDCLLRAIGIGTTDLSVLSSIYVQIGNAYFYTGDHTNSIKFHTNAHVLARFLGDPRDEALACGNLGRAWRASGVYNEAITFLERQLEVAQKLEDEKIQRTSLLHLGSCYALRAKKNKKQPVALLKGMNLDISTVQACSLPSGLLGPTVEEDIQKSVDYFRRSLKLTEAANDDVMSGRLYGLLGNAFSIIRDYKESIEWYTKRLESSRKTNDKRAMQRAYLNLGNLHALLEDMPRAIEYYRLALSLAYDLRDKISEAHCCFTIANAHTLMGESEQAADYHVRHLELARSLQDSTGELMAYSNLASDYRSMNEPAKAAYFHVMNRRTAKKLRDKSEMQAAHEALKELVRAGKLEVRDGEVCLDSSADPCSQPVRLSPSLRSLDSYGDENSFFDGTLSTLDRTGSNPSRTSTESKIPKGGQFYTQEEFFEMLNKMQGDRLDDQRCEAPVLRRESVTSIVSTVTSPGKSNRKRRKSLMGRLKSVKSSVFQPLSTSTPLVKRMQSLGSMSSLRSAKSKKTSRASSPGRQSLVSLPEGDECTDSVECSGLLDRNVAPPQMLDLSATSTIASQSEEVEFRVPQVPARRMASSISAVTLPTSRELKSPVLSKNRKPEKKKTPLPPPRKARVEAITKADSPESLWDLIMNSSHQYDDQRVVLPGLSDMKVLKKKEGDDCESGSKIDEHLCEMVKMAQQGTNFIEKAIEEQRVPDENKENGERSGKGVTVPDDEITALVLKMRNTGRVE